MQTFLPHMSFYSTAVCLDFRRLGKQRVEAKQIVETLEKIKSNNIKRLGWKNHPAVLMWKGYEESLKLYTNIMIKEWIERGYNNTLPFYEIDLEKVKYPYWLGDFDFHSSHRSNLLRKDYEFYSKYEWNVPLDLPYVWPTKNLATNKINGTI